MYSGPLTLFTTPPLPPNHYFFRVFAVNERGRGEASDSVKASLIDWAAEEDERRRANAAQQLSKQTGAIDALRFPSGSRACEGVRLAGRIQEARRATQQHQTSERAMRG